MPPLQLLKVVRLKLERRHVRPPESKVDQGVGAVVREVPPLNAALHEVARRKTLQPERGERAAQVGPQVGIVEHGDRPLEQGALLQRNAAGVDHGVHRLELVGAEVGKARCAHCTRY